MKSRITEQFDLKRHGGEIVVAYAPIPEPNGSETPDEIQILKISDRTDFESFMKDPDRLKMSDERNAVIRKVEVYISSEIISY